MNDGVDTVKLSGIEFASRRLPLDLSIAVMHRPAHQRANVVSSSF
jgi:hypothetical protein